MKNVLCHKQAFLQAYHTDFLVFMLLAFTLPVLAETGTKTPSAIPAKAQRDVCLTRNDKDSTDNKSTDKSNSQENERASDSDTVLIKTIYICAQDVFDDKNEDENSTFYQAVNFLHIKTKNKYLKEQLLFEPGDTVDQRLLDETERELRKNNYIQTAEITTQANPHEPEAVDVVVRTADSWTTEPTLSYGRSGGVSTSSFGLREDNLFGMGIRFSVKRKNDIDRDSTEFKFTDDTFVSSDKALTAEYANTSDGYVKGLRVSKPYLSLDDRVTYGFSYRNEIREDHYYVLGEENMSFKGYHKDSDIYFGTSKGFVNGKTIRHQWGLQNRSTQFRNFFIEPVSVYTPEIMNIVETDSHATYYQLQVIQDRFKKVYNIHSIGKVEDRNYGYELRTRLGIADSFSDTDTKQIYNEIELARIFEISKDSDLLFSTEFMGLVDAENSDEALTAIDIEYFKSQSHNFKFFSSLNMDYGHNLRNGQQIYLDNMTGLRGYPVNHLSGDRSILFTVEERVYFDKVLWNVVNTGAAIFVDVGDISGDPELDKLDIEYYRSVGIGLRLGSSRSSNTNILHIDFAKPLDVHSGSRDYQFAIEMKDRF